MKKLLLLLLLSLPAAAAPILPADTLLLRKFLVAAADTSVYDSVLVARFMCSDFLFRRHEPHVDTVVSRLRSSLYFLRAGVLRNQPSVRRSKVVAFRELPHKPFTLVDGEEGAYVLLDGEQPLMCLLVRNKRIAAFEISFYAGPGKGHFRDYCH